MNRKIIRIIIFIISAVTAVPLMISALSCSVFNLENFGFGPDEDTGTEESGTEDTPDTDGNKDSSSTLQDTTAGGDNDTNIQDPGISYTGIDSSDTEKLRLYYKEAIKYYDEKSYLISEYYFNKIKYSYLLLQDHIFYYLAKILLIQEKYDESEEHYRKLIDNYPDSIWTEKASLDYADLLYGRQDYINAEIEYEYFLSTFPDSEYVPYCLFQLAVSQEANTEYDKSFENYKKIWLEYPLSEYSPAAFENLERFAEEELAEPFIPADRQIFERAEIFFSSYDYHNTLEELDKLLGGDYVNNLSQILYSKVLFKKGMCYYNLGDYGQARDYLIRAYEKNPSGSVADDSLFFIARSLTNLDSTSDAISYFNKLLKLFPGSNYSDDALYRIGRIYSLEKNYSRAAEYFQRVPREYPGGDKLSDSLWEFGLIKYKSANYGGASTAFSDYASSYKGTRLEEKGLFWEAKCRQKLGEDDKAVDLYRKIIELNSYSYYTFASAEMLDGMGLDAEIKEIDDSLNPENPLISDEIPDIYTFLEQGSESSHINKAIELYGMEFFNSAALEIEAAESETEEDPAGILKIATLFLKSNDYAGSIRIIYKNFSKLKSKLDQSHIDYLYYLYYPYGYKEAVIKYSNQYALDPLFTLSVIRQESNFLPDAGSYAGAQGLMQIMPATGEGIAGQIGISGYDTSLLLDPDTNIRMGTYYLRQQLDNFDQNQVYCLGAYNGGPGKMSEWISKRGSMDIDEFIENISYEQTREYIKIVMGNYYLYQMLYD